MLYVAPGQVPDPDTDPEWAARVERHRARRPASWRTVEGHDLVAALQSAEASAGGAVLVDCLGTWLTAVIDAQDAWSLDGEQLLALVQPRLEEVVTALASHAGTVVLVTNEVGMGVVPEHRSGRAFRDLLGLTNQRVASACEEVHLVVAGRVLVL